MSHTWTDQCHGSVSLSWGLCLSLSVSHTPCRVVGMSLQCFLFCFSVLICHNLSSDICLSAGSPPSVHRLTSPIHISPCVTAINSPSSVRHKPSWSGPKWGDNLLIDIVQLFRRMEISKAYKLIRRSWPTHRLPTLPTI